MPYESLLENDVIRLHGLSDAVVGRRILEMSQVLVRHQQDADNSDTSIDGRYNFTYAVARIAAEIVMLAEGYRPGRAWGNHAAVFAFLKTFPDATWQKQAKLFDDARKMRNILEYERANLVTPEDLEELRAQVDRFLYEMKLWLQADHRELQAT